MPGYTHSQRAQPVRWAHWLMAHAAAFKQDLERLRQVYERVNLSSLGCGALAGNVFQIDRYAIAKELGFVRLADVLDRLLIDAKRKFPRFHVTVSRNLLA